jgi:MFS family permease
MIFVDRMWFAQPVFVIFLLSRGMSLTQIGWIVGASYIASFILDIPSSVWADKYSRKFILILSSAAFTLLNITFFLSNSFWMFFLGFCFNGIGTAFSSGILSAFTFDTLLSLGKEKHYEKVQSRIVQYSFIGRIIGSAAGVYFYYIDPRMPFLLSALANFVCFLVTFSLKEPTREKSISKSFDQIKGGLNFLFKHKTIWSAIVIFSVVNAIYDVFYNYFQPVMKASEIPLAYFGIIYIFINIFGFLGASFYPRIKSKIDWKNIIIAYLIIDFVSSVFFGAQIAALVVLSVVLLTFSAGFYDIYVGNIIHNIVPSSHRATTMSIQGQIYMLFFLVFINVVNFFTDHNSIFYGMMINACIALLALLAFLVTNSGKKLAHAKADLSF